jgi:GntP family gluconate:H+ symporter
MEFIVLILGILLLLTLIVKFNVETFVALIGTSVLVAFGLGMNPADIAGSIQKGLGDTLGNLALVFGMGAMLGRLIADAGGAYQIATTLIEKFGRQRLQLAIVVSAFILGIALFFEVGMVLLIPIVFAIALEARVPLLYLGIPMAASLSATHGFLPPHPAPTAIAGVLGANPGTVLWYGFWTAIPAVLIAGPLFSRLARKYAPDAFTIKKKLSAFGDLQTFDKNNLPPFGIAVLTALLPVILMAVRTIWQMLTSNGQTPENPTGIDAVMEMLGTPSIAILISLILGMFTMGFARGRSAQDIKNSFEAAIKSIAGLLLVTAGGAAFKQVLIDGGVGDAVAKIFEGTSMSPILLAWIIAVILRVALGSATVAALTAAGLVLPLLGASTVNPAFVVIAIGAGSVAASHVNDSGFWMFKEYFDLNIKQTFQIWTVLETLIAVVGLIMALTLSAIFS